MTALYLLDTNILSDLIRNPKGLVASRIEQVGQASLCTSIIVAAELHYGCAKKGSPILEKKLEDLLAQIPVLPLEAPAASLYGAIRTGLEAAGTPIGHNDLLIGTQAYSLGLTLVTANEREFRRIIGLRVENWLMP